MMDFTARDRLKFLLGGGSALMLASCGGGGGDTAAIVQQAFTNTPTPPVQPTTPTYSSGGDQPEVTVGKLRDFYTNNFQFGSVMQDNYIGDTNNPAERLVIEQFNSITPEFELKPDQLAPTEGNFQFDRADRLVDWALENNLNVRGHTLLWHVTTPDYFLQGSRDDIRARLEDYITTVMQHFAGRITEWDVVNEALSTDIFNGAPSADGPYRRSNWYNAVGNEDYIEWAFRAARAADPNAKLFLNDYETENDIKRTYLVDVLRDFNAKAIPLDGIGHQAHIFIDTDPASVIAAIDAVDNEFMGLVNHVTELDVSFYRDPGSCFETNTGCLEGVGEEAPADLLATQAQIYRDLLNSLVNRSSVENVTLWAAHDGVTWLNNNPVEGRANHPVLFDRAGEAKSAYHAITEPNFEI